MSVMDKVDAVTSLARNNELQLLVFRISHNEDIPYYGINVFKTREVVNAKNFHITELPGVNPLLEGTLVLRGLQVPIINLPEWLGHNFNKEMIKESKFLICDFNGITLGFRILTAYRVVKRNWSDMHSPDAYSMGDSSVIINDTKLEDGSICLVLDYERLLSEVIPAAVVNPEEVAESIDFSSLPEKLKKGIVLIAEDSKTAQRHLKLIFDKTKIKYKMFNNGKALIDFLFNFPNIDDIAAVITDIEMPEMSGFTVTKMIKESEEFNHIPVVINSSMTGDNNKREALSLGADGFIAKIKSKDAIAILIDLLSHREIDEK